MGKQKKEGAVTLNKRNSPYFFSLKDIQFSQLSNSI